MHFDGTASYELKGLRPAVEKDGVLLLGDELAQDEEAVIRAAHERGYHTIKAIDLHPYNMLIEVGSQHDEPQTYVASFLPTRST